MNTEDTARATRIPQDRIADIVEAAEGLIVATVDGVRYVLVPPERPDQDGKTGLMYFTAPDPTRSYSFPIYTPLDADEVAETPAPKSKRGKGKVDVTAPGDAEPVIAEVPEAKK